jgi:hypothetical protein
MLMSVQQERLVAKNGKQVAKEGDEWRKGERGWLKAELRVAKYGGGIGA